MLNIKTFLKSVLLKDSSNWRFWIILSICIKSILFIFLINKGDYNNLTGFWGALGSDTEAYTTALERLIYTGHYSPDFRMPGYAVLYVPLLLLFKKTIALNILILCQLILASVSVYALALVSKYIFKSDTLFYITYYLFLISIFSNMYDHVLASESIATSFLLLSVYFLAISTVLSLEPPSLIISSIPYFLRLSKLNLLRA